MLCSNLCMDLYLNVRAGNMQVVDGILNGLAKRSAEDGEQGLGRHGSTIRLGRSLWQTPPLAAVEANKIQECCFPEGHFPNRKDCKKALHTSSSARAKLQAWRK